MLVDSHCHLDHFEKEGIEDVVARAKSAGVGQLVTISVQVSQFEKLRNIAHADDALSFTVGTHPHHAGKPEEKGVTQADLVRLAADPQIVGIGESGLDYFYKNSEVDDQKESFRKHIRACLETDLPLVVHARDADEDCAQILKEECDGGRLRGVMHCFSSGRALAEAALEIGFYISFSGILTFKKSEELRAIARDVPKDRLLVETDAPYLAPEPYRGKRNEPANVVHTARRLGELFNMDEAEIAALTTANFHRLFDRAPVLTN